MPVADFDPIEFEGAFAILANGWMLTARRKRIRGSRCRWLGNYSAVLFFREDLLVNDRLFALVLVATTCLFVGGCQPESATSTREREISGSTVKVPVIEGVTLEGVKAKLGAQYTVRQEGTPTVLVRAHDESEIVMMVNHDSSGNVNSIVCHVVVPDGSDDKLDQLCAETTKALTELVGVAPEPKFDDYVKMGVARSRLGSSHTFVNGRLYFCLTPKNALPENSKWVEFKPNHGYRDVVMMPRKPKGASDSVSAPIEGSSFEQLKQVLEGFEIRVQLEGEQVLFSRELDDHTQYVYCELQEGGQVTLIDAFVGSMSEGADATKLNSELWLMLAQWQYKDCDPEKVVTFLSEPEPPYAIDFIRTIGFARFCRALGPNNRRDRLVIWAAEPQREM